MGTLSGSDILMHFSHAGVDEMADNTTHHGIKIACGDIGYAQNGTRTMLLFPADKHQMKAVVDTVFYMPGIRLVFSTRSAVPTILRPGLDEVPLFSAEHGYRWEPGKDDIVLPGRDGYIITYGEMLCRAIDAAYRLRGDGSVINVGVINRSTLNALDEDTLALVGSTSFALYVESQDVNTGFGSMYGTALLERGHHVRYAHMGTNRPGEGGLHEQLETQGLTVDAICEQVQRLA